MKQILLIILLVGIIAGVVWYVQKNKDPVVEVVPPVVVEEQNVRIDRTYKDILVVKNLTSEGITSPLTIEGEARGMWYFEASFPIVLTNWDGLIIAQGIAEAQGDWMNEAYVPFKATLTFEPPYRAGDPEFMKGGSLILKKDNPSGLPEHDDAFEVPVTFTPSQN